MVEISSGDAGEARRRSPRRRQILEALAHELESNPGERITTAALARAVGVSEAALYRHFPSKATMFEGLIEFIEDSVFGLINRILADERGAVVRCERIIAVLLGFAERNPGISRILVGDALVGENARLRSRISQFYDRLETQLKQVLREGELYHETDVSPPPQLVANLMLAVVQGRISEYVRSSFQRSPLTQWSEQWRLLRQCLFTPSGVSE